MTSVSEEDLRWLVLLNRRDVEYMHLTFGTGWPDKAREWLQQCVERDRSKWISQPDALRIMESE